MGGMRKLTSHEIVRTFRAFTGYFALRNATMFIFGCNTGFRIHEILAFTRQDVITTTGEIVDEVTLQPKNLKGGKMIDRGEAPDLEDLLAPLSDDDKQLLEEHYLVRKRQRKKKIRARTVKLNSAAKMALEKLLKWQQRNGFCTELTPLFCTRKGIAISPWTAWYVLKIAFASAKVENRVATHSMRKTFGQNAHNNFMRRRAAGELIEPLKQTKELLGHVEINSTDHYIEGDDGVNEEVIEQIATQVNWTEWHNN